MRAASGGEAAPAVPPVLPFGGELIRVLATPGHTRGGLSFL